MKFVPDADFRRCQLNPGTVGSETSFTLNTLCFNFSDLLNNARAITA